MAPLYLNVAKPVVAGSPGESAPVYCTLNSFGKSVPGWPLAIFERPDNGPNENMYVWVPSPMVAYPSPPEICWHLMAPFTFLDGARYPVAGLEALVFWNAVAPVYAGSELFWASLGW